MGNTPDGYFFLEAGSGYAADPIATSAAEASAAQDVFSASIAPGLRPLVADASARDAQYPNPQGGEQVYRQDTRAIELFNGSIWTILDTEWKTWTPILTNISTIGNGSLTSIYKRSFGQVFFSIQLIWGSTTTANATQWGFSLPISATFGAQGTFVGTGGARDQSAAAEFYVHARIPNPDMVQPYLFSNAAPYATYVGIGNLHQTLPFTWANGDSLYFSGSYPTL